jgi:sec-independent protein translocase protein TatA
MNLSILLGVIGIKELIVILIIVLLLFGGKKIPELMRGLGNGIKEFKKASKGDEEPKDKKSETQTDKKE